MCLVISSFGYQRARGGRNVMDKMKTPKVLVLVKLLLKLSTQSVLINQVLLLSSVPPGNGTWAERIMEAAYRQDFCRHVQGWVKIIKQDAL